MLYNHKTHHLTVNTLTIISLLQIGKSFVIIEAIYSCVCKCMTIIMTMTPEFEREEPGVSLFYNEDVLVKGNSQNSFEYTDAGLQNKISKISNVDDLVCLHC